MRVAGCGSSGGGVLPVVSYIVSPRRKARGGPGAAPPPRHPSNGTLQEGGRADKHMSWRDELRAAVEAGPREGLPDLVGELARAQAVATLRLSENGRAKRPAPDIQPKGELIDAAAAAEILGVDVRWLYDRADELSFTRRLGPRTLRFDKPGMYRWLETRK